MSMVWDIYLNFKSLAHSVSVKTKTIILVLVVIIALSLIFFFIRYLDIRHFAEANQRSELKRVRVVYQETLQRIKKFYITRGYANIHSYGIREAFEKHDIQSLHDLSLPRWQVISKENRYVHSFAFYDNTGKLLTYFGHPPQETLPYIHVQQKPFDGFWYGNGNFTYHAVAEARNASGMIVGFLVFVVDPKYFLSQIRKIMDINAYIYYSKGSHTMLFSLHKDVEIETYIQHKRFEKNHLFETGESLYLPYVIKGKGVDRKNDFKIIFLQNVTHWHEALNTAILQSVIVLVLLLIVTIIVMNYGFDIILRQLDEVNRKLIQSQHKLQTLNKNLQEKVAHEIELKLSKEREANEKERILVHQSKLASMGEMIGNIAHQWRQPLTELSSILIYMDLYFERGKLTQDILENEIEAANIQINFMSRTIDDFRNFFSSGRQKETLRIHVPISKVEKLMSASLKNNGIGLVISIEEDFQLYVYPNELIQVLLNLLSNAKDVLIERAIVNGTVEIRTYRKGNQYALEVRDNAGGIHTQPIEKVFEPYFSTKHATAGTGIGLYMSKIIIEKNNGGKIIVHNQGSGAVFTVLFDI